MILWLEMNWNDIPGYNTLLIKELVMIWMLYFLRIAQGGGGFVSDP